ncbi:MAG: DNRLRE domain-containing protein [Planctomycetes bacterium]|nr:DNRLRE domain-containing protein [Planctomycetota bacterium]
MSRVLSLLLLAVLCLAAPLAAQTTVTLQATDTDCINPAGSNWVDNRLRAYWSSSILFVDGFMKFDLSSIPDGSAITSMKLTTYHEYGFGNPASNPEVQIYRVGNDAWSRSNSADPHPGLNEVLTPVHAGAFPVADLVPYVWDLDVNAASWSGDLLDDTLSLAMRNVAGNAGRYSYVYWYGSDASPAPPELEVTYGGGGPVLRVSNLVAGGVASLDVFGATPGGKVQYGYSLTGAGPTAVPGGGCGVIVVDLSLPIKQAGSATADPNGNASRSANVPAGTTGVMVWIQAFDVASCTLTNGVAQAIG